MGGGRRRRCCSGCVQGYAPQVSIEFARKTLKSNGRPTFIEVEEMVQNLPSTG